MTRGSRSAAMSLGSFGVAAACCCAWASAPAWAAFDLRHASPEALGAVAADLAFDPLDDRSRAVRGPGAEASHAALYDVPGLAADHVAATWGMAGGDVCVAWSRAGTPDLAEAAQSLTWIERGERRVLFRAQAERLALRFDGEPEAAGWCASAGVSARIAAWRTDSRRGVERASRGALDLDLTADRVLRGAGADRLGAGGGLVAALRLGLGTVTVAAADRWEASGRRSPRITFLVPLGPALRLRAGRGEGPGRVGLALSLRWRRIEISAGRQDGAGGGSIASAGVRFEVEP